MEDQDLEQIRQKRMAEMRAQYGQQKQQASKPQKEKEEEEAKKVEAERRAMMLAQLLEPAARERLNRIALVKPDKVRAVEDMIINAAQRGQLQAKVDEPKLIQLLEQISQQTKATTVTFQRRKYDDEDY